MELLDGRKVSQKIFDSYKTIIKENGYKIRLSVILAGNNPSSEIYVNIKKRKCDYVGISCDIIRFGEDVTEKELLDSISRLNNDSSVSAVMVQIPLPNGIDTRKIIDMIEPEKDVEGLSSYHMGQILIGQEEIIPCTPKGILRLLDEYDIRLEGRRVCIIGYSDIVGKPLGALCLNREATVTHCHIKTKNLTEHTKDADIIMTATGVPGLIKENMVKDGAVIIDIGISREGKKIIGDVDFENVKHKCSYITPVPGGVGPMTVAMLIENCVEINNKT